MALLDHVGVRVTDLERSVAFYTDLFGFKVEGRWPFGDVNAAGLRIGAGDGIIFLLEHPTYREHQHDAPDGVDHFSVSFPREEWEQVMERIRARDVPLVDGLADRGGRTGRGPSQYILDPDGNKIEVKCW